MNSHADKSQENKSQSAANAVVQKKSAGDSTLQLVDNRPEAILQGKLQEVVGNGRKETQRSSQERRLRL